MDPPEASGDGSREPPMPGTFVVGQDGVVRFAQVFADHPRRAEPSDAVDALRRLTASGP